MGGGGHRRVAQHPPDLHVQSPAQCWATGWSPRRAAIGSIAARDEVDAFRFEDAVAQARSLLESKPAEAAELLGEALALWRGHPYADVPGSARLEAEARRLEQLRLGAVEDRVEAELALGRHAELLPELGGVDRRVPALGAFPGPADGGVVSGGAPDRGLAGLSEDPAVSGRGDGDRPLDRAAGVGAAHLGPRPGAGGGERPPGADDVVPDDRHRRLDTALGAPPRRDARGARPPRPDRSPRRWSRPGAGCSTRRGMGCAPLSPRWGRR